MTDQPTCAGPAAFLLGRKTLGPFAKRDLEPLLIRIFQEERADLSLEQIVHHLYHRSQRLSELLVLSRSSIKRKQKLKRQVEQCLERGFATRTQVQGQWVYSLSAGGSCEASGAYPMTLGCREGTLSFGIDAQNKCSDLHRGFRTSAVVTVTLALAAAVALACLAHFSG